MQPYVSLLAVVALLFGVLPAGAGWYPWYVAWLVMWGVLAVIYIFFSTGHNPESVPLSKRWWVK